MTPMASCLHHEQVHTNMLEEERTHRIAKATLIQPAPDNPTPGHAAQ